MLTRNQDSSRSIDLIDEDLDAVGCFLEYLYTNDYFPRKIAGTRDLERDPATPEVDESGDQLLKHARVYTLAESLRLPSLKQLASSKIHCVNSTAKGEISYARYVYAHTQKDDTTIRAPVANFWATRSHVLRSEAEEEFRSMCLEFPQFGYDVLSEYLLPLTSGVMCMLTIPQPVFWTKSSREKRTKRCTQPQEAPASVRVEESKNTLLTFPNSASGVPLFHIPVLEDLLTKYCTILQLFVEIPLLSYFICIKFRNKS